MIIRAYGSLESYRNRNLKSPRDQHKSHLPFLPFPPSSIVISTNESKKQYYTTGDNSTYRIISVVIDDSIGFRGFFRFFSLSLLLFPQLFPPKEEGESSALMIARCREKRGGKREKRWQCLRPKGFFLFFFFFNKRHPFASIRLPTLSSSSDRDKYSAKRVGGGREKKK